jgi:SAM-dependent methyltransferase
MDLTKQLEQLIPVSSETAYGRLTGYVFARRYVAGKVVADISWDEVGLGSRLLAETAESVAGLANSTEAVDLARSAHPAPNVEYRKVDLPKLPYPEDHFDAVVALGVVENLEQPEGLVREARRVLKQDGILMISSLDKLAFADGYDPQGTGYRRGMYAVEFQELLEAHFGRVFLYRQGAVAGGCVLPISGEVAGPAVESTTLSLSSPHVSEEPPATRSVMAVCANGVGLEQEKPYLLLDRDRRVFDECEDRAEDVELLRGEIRQMQETEAQAFLDALKLRGTEIGYLRARIRNSDAQIHGLKNQIHGLKNQIRNMENSTTWRIFEPYRRLRARMGGASGTPKGSSGESGDRSG